MPAKVEKVARRSFAGGHFLLTLDEQAPAPGYVKSVSGGSVRGRLTDEEVGSDHFHFKHLGSVEIEPITLELGMSVSRPIFDWIRASWRRDLGRRSGAIVHADADLRARVRQDFFEALVAETKIPLLDGSLREPAYLQVVIHPERLEVAEEDGQRIEASIPAQQKMWAPCNFRLDIDGLDCSRVNRIESFSVKQKIKTLYAGELRFPELEPTGIDFPNLTLTMATEHAGDFIRWHQEFVVRGGADPRHERTGAIEFLDHSGQEVLFSITLQQVGIFGLSLDKSEAGATGIRRCKVELYVDSMDLSYGAGFA